MGSVNWVGISALAVLSLSFLGGTALAQENADAMERVSIDARADNSRQDQVRDMISGDGQLRRNARSGMLDRGAGTPGRRQSAGYANDRERRASQDADRRGGVQAGSEGFQSGRKARPDVVNRRKQTFRDGRPHDG